MEAMIVSKHSSFMKHSFVLRTGSRSPVNRWHKSLKAKAGRAGFEPAWATPNGFRIRRN